jgi:hypothetical protein
MVPMRAIFEELGATVDWDGATQTVTGIRGNTTVVMRINERVMYVDGREVTIDVPPSLINGRTLVPVRVIAEGLGMGVVWDAASRTVIITSGSQPPIPPESIRLGTIFSDYAIGMQIIINNTEWTALKQGNQIFFLNDVNPSEENLISISSYLFFEGEDPELASTWLWEEMMEAHRSTPFTNFVYEERQPIQVGAARHHGYLYAFTVTDSGGDVLIIANTLVWIADNRIYLCTARSRKPKSKQKSLQPP